MASIQKSETRDVVPMWERAGHRPRGGYWLPDALKFVSQSPDTDNPNTGGVAPEAAAAQEAQLCS